MGEVNFAVEVGNAICAEINSSSGVRTGHHPTFTPLSVYLVSLTVSDPWTNPLEFGVRGTSVGPTERDSLTGTSFTLATVRTSTSGYVTK